MDQNRNGLAWAAVGYPDYSKIKIYMTILFVLMKTPTFDNWVMKTHCDQSGNITGFVLKIITIAFHVYSRSYIFITVPQSKDYYMCFFLKSSL